MHTPNDPEGFMITDAHGRLLRFTYDGKYYWREWLNAPPIVTANEQKKIVTCRAYDNALKRRNKPLDRTIEQVTYREQRRKLYRGGKIPAEWWQDNRN